MTKYFLQYTLASLGKVVSLVLCTVALYACGGGGDSGGGTPALALFAGDMGGPGNVDGKGLRASFLFPSGVTSDAKGNVYVADSDNHTIRKITPDGEVTTLTGKAGERGSTDGLQAEARFYAPGGVTVDTNGNLYVLDTYNHTIRKITTGGVVTTLAGKAGQPGSADGDGAAARFEYPRGIAIDANDQLYVADTNNHVIRKITLSGQVTTLAGRAVSDGSADGIGLNARFSYPRGIAIDVSGNIYVADTDNYTIRKITPQAVVSTLAGRAARPGSVDGTGSAARFAYPSGIAVDAEGNAYVADTGNQAIRKVMPTGEVVTLAGVMGVRGSTDGDGAAARFFTPAGMCIDRSGNVYVSDLHNANIRKITSAGVVTTLAGAASVQGSDDGVGANARFSWPDEIVSDSSGNIYVADSSNSIIRKITRAGEVTTVAGKAGEKGSVDGVGEAARFYDPLGMTIDAGGNLYTASHHAMRKITSAGVVTTVAGKAGVSGADDGSGLTARFRSSQSVAADAFGNIYVADTENHTIRKITPAGEVTTFAGKAGETGSADGTGADARFYSPSGIVVGAFGNLFVADTDNHIIRKITPAGKVTTLAGKALTPGAVDGKGADARFNSPQAVGLDSRGYLYVADTDNNIIRKITHGGDVSTVVGQVGMMGFSPGSLPGVLSSPQGVAIYGRSLYITMANGVAVVTNVP